MTWVCSSHGFAFPFDDGRRLGYHLKAQPQPFGVPTTVKACILNMVKQAARLLIAPRTRSSASQLRAMPPSLRPLLANTQRPCNIPSGAISFLFSAHLLIHPACITQKADPLTQWPAAANCSAAVWLAHFPRRGLIAVTKAQCLPN